MSPKVYGEEGPFVQSDIQFVQQVAEDMLSMHGSGFSTALEKVLATSIGARFFVTEGTTSSGAPKREMVASSLYVSYAQDFAETVGDALFQEELESGSFDPDESSDRDWTDFRT